MKQNTARYWIVAGTVLILGAVNYSIASKERIKREGVVAFLTLAPVDPRSLMQGDYMALRFALAQQIETQRGNINSSTDLFSKTSLDEGKTAFAELQLDGRRIATLAPAGASGLRIRYRIRSGQVWLGTNAFFFSEGSAQRFEPARYGEFRLDTKTGEAVLVGLRDHNLAAL
ncbi:MAG: GDYXXLXY domain-containing protein [Candidatus Obscuribacterales bacterium]|nr:GDYXXLXY domain-containing protein [Steroidobacteraceae bacterium]